MTRAEHRCLLIAVAAYAAALVLLAQWVFPAGISAEPDDYAHRGAELLAGHLGGDRYHPYLYPELIAALFALVNDAALAARTVSSLAAGLLLYSSYRLARELFGRWPAVATLLLLAANSEVIMFGLRAATDMTAAALFVTSMWLLVRHSGRRLAMALAGVMLGLAMATRLSMAPLVPVMAIAAAVMHWPRGWHALLTFGVGAVVGFLPSAVPSLIAFGTPMASDSWRNMAFKLSGDVLALESPPYSGLLDMLSTDGWRLLQLGMADFAAIWTSLLGVSLAGSHAIWPTAVAMAWATLLAAAWCVGTMRRGPIMVPLLLLLLAAIVCTALVATTFWAHTRLLLPVQPLALVWMTGALTTVCRRMPWLANAVLAVLWVGVASSVLPTLRNFTADFPVEEITAARDIAAREGPLVGIASFYGPLHREVSARIVYVPQLPFGRQPEQAYVARALDRLATHPADFLVLGPKTCGGVPTAALRQHLPDGCFVVRHDAAVLVAKMLRTDAVDWLVRGTVSVVDDRLQLAVEVRPEAAVMIAGFTVRPTDAPVFVLALERTGEHSFAAERPAPRGVEQWTFVPSCVLASGAQLLGAPITVTRR